MEEFHKQQSEEVRRKIQVENLERRATPKRVWICPMHSASVAFSRQEDENEEIKSIAQSKPAHVLFQLFASYSRFASFVLSVCS